MPFLASRTIALRKPITSPPFSVRAVSPRSAPLAVPLAVPWGLVRVPWLLPLAARRFLPLPPLDPSSTFLNPLCASQMENVLQFLTQASNVPHFLTRSPSAQAIFSSPRSSGKDCLDSVDSSVNDPPDSSVRGGNHTATTKTNRHTSHKHTNFCMPPSSHSVTRSRTDGCLIEPCANPFSRTNSNSFLGPTASPFNPVATFEKVVIISEKSRRLFQRCYC